MQLASTIRGGSLGEIDYLAAFDPDTAYSSDRLQPATELRQNHYSASPPQAEDFDWEQCVADFGDEYIQQLAEWRGYSEEFCQWLHSKELVGIYDGNWAFPVSDDDGGVSGCHYRVEDGTWRYFPGGTTKALILGSRDAREIWAFESQWDAFAVMDVLDWHKNDLSKKVRIVITRGCSNGKLVGGLSRSDTKVLTFAQNDPVDAKGNSPAKKWLEAVISHAGCPVSLVVIPSEHQDANDWTRAGATQEDVWTAIESAEPQASQAAPEETDNSDTMIVLPANGTSITKCAEKLFTKISRDTTLFSRNGRVMEVSVLKGKAILQVVSNHGFRSRIEQYGSCYIERSGANGETVLKATIPSVDAAAALLEAPAVNLLPPIAGLVNAPVLLNDEKGCRLVEQGYDRGSSLMVTGGAVLYPIPLEEATKALHEMLAEFAFQTPGDRSRALAALITPALRFGGHIRGPIPIDLAEADDSQSGKTYRIKCTAAIYNGLLSFVSQKNGGVGSYEETFDQALINGQPFILFDNWRGKFDSPHLEAFITAQGIFPARVPYKGLVNIDTTYFILSMTSNGLETTRDLAKRSSIVRIRKRPGHAFKEYAEGELLDHVVANQAYYLGCVFAIVQAWLEAGKPRTNERRHDFREWSQSLDWIVQNLLDGAPLLGDHESAQQRVSSPGLSFVRQIALAVEASGSLNEELTCTAIYCLASECGVEIPMLRAGDQSSGARTIGTHLGKLFTPEENVVESEGFNIQRNKVKMARDNGQGPKDQNRFIFSRPATPVSPQNAKE